MGFVSFTVFLYASSEWSYALNCFMYLIIKVWGQPFMQLFKLDCAYSVLYYKIIGKFIYYL